MYSIPPGGFRHPYPALAMNASMSRWADQVQQHTHFPQKGDTEYLLLLWHAVITFLLLLPLFVTLGKTKTRKQNFRAFFLSFVHKNLFPNRAEMTEISFLPTSLLAFTSRTPKDVSAESIRVEFRCFSIQRFSPTFFLSELNSLVRPVFWAARRSPRTHSSGERWKGWESIGTNQSPSEPHASHQT